ncbi:MAG: CoA-binding protein [Acidimicrobiales bacterium]|nr:CoA-binding protein [Acidimicrobiales bacterium]
MTESVPIAGWTVPSDTARRRLLASMQTVAMVGVSANPARPSNFVATYLLATDYEVYFVNPTVERILGRPCVPSLADLPVVPDCVNVFRRLDDVPAVANEAVAVGARVFWTQFGLWSAEAARTVLDAGMDLVMDRCLKVEHARFYGDLHLAGFDTGVIDSRRNRDRC